jgi:hypothetical protein
MQPEGIRLVKGIGFTGIEPLTPGRRTFVINIKGSGIPLYSNTKSTRRGKETLATQPNYVIIELVSEPVVKGKARTPMPTIEERLQALEQENTARKKTEELLTIAVRALVSKEAFEKLQDTVEKSQKQNSRLFDVLNNHNIFTNERLGNIQNQITELDGKIVGQQTEIRQQITELDGKTVGLQTEIRQRFAEQDDKTVGLQTTQAEHTTLLQQILARLPEKP